jgi:hypothetical protein
MRHYSLIFQKKKIFSHVMESVAKIKLNHFLNLLPTYGYSAEKLIFYDSIIHQVAKLRALSFKI